MQPLDDADEFVDGEREFVEFARSVVADSHFLNLPVDVSQGDANVWGETSWVVWSHTLEAYGPLPQRCSRRSRPHGPTPNTAPRYG
jgi:hypothetical protein